MEHEPLITGLRAQRTEAMRTRRRLDSLQQRLEQLPPRQLRAEQALRRCLERECGALRQDLEQLRQQSRQTERLLAALPDVRQRTVLTLRYLDGLSWREIGDFFEDTGEPLSERQLYRIHREALAAAEELALHPATANAKIEAAYTEYEE